MIANCRLDLTEDELCEALTGSPERGCADRTFTRGATGARVVCPVSRARDGLRWVLGRYGVGRGDEVLMPDLMCDTAGEAVMRTGARLVTYGLAAGTFRPSVESCERAVSATTKALVVPHLYGIPADMAGFARLSGRHHLLLIEDSALRFPAEEGALANYESPAACVLYSFNYGKPLSLGWGGLLSLARPLAVRMGLPGTAPMAEEDDRFYAAALLLGQVVTGPARPGGYPVRADAGLHLLSRKGGGRRPAVPDWSMVDEVLAAARNGMPSLLAWCEMNAARIRPPAGGMPPPAGIGGLVERGRDLAAMVSDRVRAASSVDDAGPAESLLPGGYAERLLQAQRRALEGGAASESRRAVAAVYAAALDPDRWLFPAADQADHWLSYPVVAKWAVRRGRLVRKVVERIGVDVHPYVWPDVLHRVAHLRHAVTAGPGSHESARFVDGLLNLPVHAQMSPDKAQALAGLLNREA